MDSESRHVSATRVAIGHEKERQAHFIIGQANSIAFDPAPRNGRRLKLRLLLGAADFWQHGKRADKQRETAAFLRDKNRAEYSVYSDAGECRRMDFLASCIPIQLVVGPILEWRLHLQRRISGSALPTATSDRSRRRSDISSGGVSSAPPVFGSSVSAKSPQSGLVENLDSSSPSDLDVPPSVDGSVQDNVGHISVCAPPSPPPSPPPAFLLL